MEDGEAVGDEVTDPSGFPPDGGAETTVLGVAVEVPEQAPASTTERVATTSRDVVRRFFTMNVPIP